jgi:hypothetical protein
MPNESRRARTSAQTPPLPALQQRLRRRRAVVAHQLAQLDEDVAACRVGTEDEAGDRDDDQQQRRDRKQRVVGERRAHARGVIVDPGAGGLPAECVQRSERHGVNPGTARKGTLYDGPQGQARAPLCLPTPQPQEKHP